MQPFRLFSLPTIITCIGWALANASCRLQHRLTFLNSADTSGFARACRRRGKRQANAFRVAAQMLGAGWRGSNSAVVALNGCSAGSMSLRGGKPASVAAGWAAVIFPRDPAAGEGGHGPRESSNGAAGDWQTLPTTGKRRGGGGCWGLD